MSNSRVDEKDLKHELLELSERLIVECRLSCRPLAAGQTCSAGCLPSSPRPKQPP